MITLTITVNADAPVGTLELIRKGLEIGDLSAPGPVRRGLNDATDRYDSFVIRRFDTLSVNAGGGEWPGLAASTLRRKLGTGRGVITTRKSRAGAARGAGGPKVVRVLVETGKLRASLELSGRNHIRQSIPNGVRTGSKDPKIKFHQVGMPGRRLPARPVYVMPPQPTLTAMAGDVALGVRKLMEQAAEAAAAGAPASP